MSKGKHRRQQPIPAPRPPLLPPSAPVAEGTVQVPLGYDPKGKKQHIDIVSSKDGWSEYTLEDETVIRAKTTILDVEHLIGQFSPDGDPLYLMKMTMITQVKAPNHLKKKD